MLRLVQFTRNVGGRFLRASLRDDCAPLPSQVNHPVSIPQILFSFDDQSHSFIDQSDAGIISSYNIDQSGFLPSGTSNQEVVRVTNSGESGRGRPGRHGPDLLQALHYGAILAVSLSLVHDWKRLHGSLYNNLFCPVVRLKEVKSLQAQPIVERTDEPQGGVIPPHHTDKLLRYEESISIEKQLNFEEKNSIKNDKKNSEVKELTEELSRLSTSDYSSHHSSSLPQLSPAELEIVRLQKSIPSEVDSLLALQRIRNGEEGAVEELKRLVKEENSPSAMFYLGQAYHYGQQVDRDVERAMRLYRAAADLGNCEAKYNLGVHLVREEDMVWGMALIEEAARMGLEEAKAALEMQVREKQLKKVKPVMKSREVQEVMIIARQMEEDGDLVMAREMYRVIAIHGHRKAARQLGKLNKTLERRENK